MQSTWPYWCFLWASFNLSAQWSIAPSDIWQARSSGWQSVHEGYYPGWNTLDIQWHRHHLDLSTSLNGVVGKSSVALGSTIPINASHTCRWSLRYRAAQIQVMGQWHWRQDAITHWHMGMQTQHRDVAVSLTMVSHGPSGWHVIIGSQYHINQSLGQWTVGAMRHDGPIRSVICEGSGLVRVQLAHDAWLISLGWSPWGPSSSVGQQWLASP